MRSRILPCAIALTAVLPLVAQSDPAAAFKVINSAESAEQFRQGKGTRDAKVGERAVVFDVPPGTTSFFALTTEGAGIDLNQYAGLAFWWKVEGDGLRSLTLKTRCPSMHEGRQLVFPVWRKGASAIPREWAAAQVSFAERGGMQGDPSSARVIEFRTETDRGSNTRLFIDHVVALTATFRVRVAPTCREGDRWVAPVEFRNDSGSDITVDYCTGETSRGALRLAAGQTIQKRLGVPLDSDAFSRLLPLEGLGTPFWAEQRGLELTRTRSQLRVLKPVDLPPHPRLMVDAAQIAEIRDRIRKHDWAGEQWKTLRRGSDAAQKRPIELPPRGGVSAHHYANPKTGGHLKAGKEIGPWEWEHVDGKTGETFRGDPSAHRTDYDGVRIGYVHAGWAREARDQALAYQITRETPYAQRARDILLAYSATYLSYPRTRHGDPKTHGIGRATANYLTESTWVIDMAQAADMVWDRLTADERRALADRVFYPALRDSIDPVRCNVHNIQCWKNSALGLVGLLYDDSELLHKALCDESEGYWQQLREGILPGGMWYEGSWGYHFYTMSALVSFTEACRHCGIDLYVDRLRDLYLAPIRSVMPDMRLPNFNDAGLIDLTKSSYRYELAAARWDEPVFRAMLAHTNRRSREALLHGVDAAGNASDTHVKSTNHSGAGYAVLAQGEGKDATWLCLKYSPSAGYHDHPDRLSFILYARGRIVAPDPGSLSYGLALQRDWYKTTLSHSTLAVDEKSQQRQPAKCLAFGSENGVDYTMLDSGEAISGVRFVRSAVLIDRDLIVFVDQVGSDRERVLDFAYHQAGEWTDLPPGQPWTPPDDPTYTCLKAATVRDATDGLTVATRLGDEWDVAVAWAGGAATEAITGTGPGIGGAHSQVPCLILRRCAAATALVWAVALDGRPPTFEWVENASGEPRWQVACVRVSAPGRAPLTLRVTPDHATNPISIQR